MCKFFSLNSDGKGKIYYFDWKARKKYLQAGDDSPDSHTTIAHHFGFKGKKKDRLNKWEYNPLTQKLTCDQLNTTNDTEQVLCQCKKLNFKKIAPALVIKPIVNPFEIEPPKKITAKHLKLLREWDSVGDSVWKVRASVWDSVRYSVGHAVWDSVWKVGASVRYSVGHSVRASVRHSVGDSVWHAVGKVVWAYTSSFFKIKYKHDVSSVVKLWEMGLVPTFDGKIWRLHGGIGGRVLWEGCV